MTGKRSRFRRSKAATIQLTERDITILRALEQHRFLTTDHLLALTGGTSRQGLTRRLRELYDAKYIDRPRAQMMALAYADKRPMIYALGNEGAELLSNRFQMALPDVYWTEKNRRVKEKFVEHTLGISDFMVSLETACRDAGNIRIITKDDMLTASPEATRRKRHPVRWQTRIHWNNQWHDVAIVPDIIFGLHYTDRPEGKNKAYFMVEIDRGTMPITRRDIRQTSFARKLHSYADTFERKLHVEHFGIKNFRVLTVTTSKERVETMIGAYKSEIVTRAPQGLFLFRTKDSIPQKS
ncbi:replication-relaxation family protein [Yoonia sp. GPGPB17]|uniref:replication-relaxation family protein n=1 Tax=Yoonia sp. GPGPB17 TaxID=3026147 RepID=UPI0030BC5C4B